MIAFRQQLEMQPIPQTLQPAMLLLICLTRVRAMQW
jgi:hypothetical protein